MRGGLPQLLRRRLIAAHDRHPRHRRGVAALARHYKLAVATSKPLAFADPLLQALGLRHFFSAVAGPDLRAQTEDKAQTISNALAALGNPERAVMVGDRFFDIRGARARSVLAIGVTWGIGGERNWRPQVLMRSSTSRASCSLPRAPY